ncbi:centromere protein Q [Cololabis saira]|uniref:centromere protein Q n=1 Tax=Cololabis saira TaxID=129043 RepID=UPI002AD339DC|nr:centromere protein Q [Cololabis saira]XP_061597657.1 centromere protein Q [Cololabis saira]
MKPVRGSSRAPLKAPNRKNKSKKPREGKPNQEQGDDNHLKPAHKRRGVTHPVSKKTRLQNNCMAMPGSAITAVENILDMAILTSLSLSRTKKKEIQEHLNMMKNKFLAQCAELKVPVRKRKGIVNVFQRHREETEKLAIGKKTLRSLEEDLKAVCGALERTEEQITSLQHTCSMLKNELEDEEEKAKQILKLTDQTVLKLLPFPSTQQ